MPIPVLSVLAAAVFAAITTEVLPVGLLPIISRDLGTSDSRVGLLVSAYAVVVALGSIPLTAVMVRWPRKQVLSGLLVIYAISNALLAGTDQFSVALMARLVGGLAHAGSSPSSSLSPSPWWPRPKRAELSQSSKPGTPWR